MLRLFRKKTNIAPTATLKRTYTNGDIQFTPEGALAGTEAFEWLQRAEEFHEWETVYYLQQLEQEEWGPVLDDSFLLPWGSVYELQLCDVHASSLPLLNLPETAQLRPSLTSYGSLSDVGFRISLGWLDENNRPVSGVKRTGGLVAYGGKTHLLTEQSWKLAEAIKNLATRTPSTPQDNRCLWGKVREIALAADARLDNYLQKSVIISLDKLDIDMRVVHVNGTKVVEIAPTAEGVPQDKWLSSFDGYDQVQDHYDILLPGNAMMRVIPDEAVKTVLREIRKMPGRRVSGNRALNFLRNPYAVLGEDMAKVLPPERFETLRIAAGIVFSDFDLVPKRNDRGAINCIVISLKSENTEEIESAAHYLRLQDKSAVMSFVRKIRRAKDTEMPCFHWQGHELELRGNTAGNLQKLTGYLAECWAAEQPVISAEEILDISRYSARIMGIDEYKPVYSPYIQKTDKDGSWIPDDIQPIISYQPSSDAPPVNFSVTPEQLQELDEQILHATVNGETRVRIPDWPGDMDIQDAQNILDAYQPLLNAIPTDKPKGLAEDEAVLTKPELEAERRKKTRLQLLIGENIENADYVEKRGQLLALPENTEPELPSTLAPNISLKNHQLSGVAWLQNLWQHPAQAHGCVFADDMGLGKTLQILTFIHWYLERTPNPQPVLVVAPVSLLENWQNEIGKFFKPGASKVMLLYGAALNAVKLKQDAIAPDLLDKGLVRFLKPDWRNDAQIVLTSYEVLRDQELSLAAENWGIMVCDEAQRIKNPNALVTRAAKKQNVRFCVACTGTPVENTLTDLWCLFDYIQPGLLPPLNTFSKRYVRPIEAKTDEKKASLDELRALTAPQILRRMKEEVTDLKPKHENTDGLSISAKQVGLYSSAIAPLKYGAAGGKAFVLPILHQLRMICADPSHLKFGGNPAEPLAQLCVHSPKLNWLLGYLEIAKAKQEKVIVFTEFLDVQRRVQRAIQQRLGLQVAVVNGGTKSCSVRGEQTRQRIIDRFQEAEGFNVIVLSTTAIGFGVNIQAANHVVHFTRPWNPAKENQATDRAYRIGQEKEVFVQYPTIQSADFETFEVKLAKLIDAKKELAADMLNCPGEIDYRDFALLQDEKGENVNYTSSFSSDVLDDIGPLEFEDLCKDLWLAQGYSQAYTTPPSGDGGIDVVAIKGDEGVLVQCKSTSSNRPLGWDAVKDVVAGAAAYQARHPGVRFERAIATNGKFNDTAHKQAALHNVAVYERRQIEKLIQKANGNLRV